MHQGKHKHNPQNFPKSGYDNLCKDLYTLPIPTMRNENDLIAKPLHALSFLNKWCFTFVQKGSPLKFTL